MKNKSLPAWNFKSLNIFYDAKIVSFYFHDAKFEICKKQFRTYVKIRKNIKTAAKKTSEDESGNAGL